MNKYNDPNYKSDFDKFSEKNMKIQQFAYGKLVKNKETKEELEILIKWANSEIKQWNKFLLKCKKRLNDKL